MVFVWGGLRNASMNLILNVAKPLSMFNSFAFVAPLIGIWCRLKTGGSLHSKNTTLNLDVPGHHQLCLFLPWPFKIWVLPLWKFYPHPLAWVGINHYLEW